MCVCVVVVSRIRSPCMDHTLVIPGKIYSISAQTPHDQGLMGLDWASLEGSPSQQPPNPCHSCWNATSCFLLLPSASVRPQDELLVH